MRGSKQVAERVVQQVDEGGGIQVSVAHHLGGKESLSGSTAEQTPHHTVAHVHVMGDFLGGEKNRHKGWNGPGVEVESVETKAAARTLKVCRINPWFL